MRKMGFALGAMVIGMSATGAQAADVLIPGSGSPKVLTSTEYTQDFDSLKPSSQSTIPADALPDGWQGFESGSSANATYQFGSASSSNAGVWSYGLGGASDRGLGGRTGLSVPQVYFGAIFENGLGGVIDALDISYTGEQWQNGFTRATLNFEYSLDATSIVDGTWTSFDGLDFLAPNSAAHAGSRFAVYSTRGDQAAFRASIADTIDGLSIGAGDTFGIRWSLTDLGDSNSSDGLAVDDFHLSASLAPAAAVPEPATWLMMIGGFGMIGGMLRRRRTAGSRIALA